MFMESQVILYILLVPCLLCSAAILLKFYWSASDGNIKLNAFHYYINKVSTIITFVLSEGLILTQIRCAVDTSYSNLLKDKVLGILYLIMFLGIIFPYSMLLINLSPQNRSPYKFVWFPNSLTFTSIFKLVAALLLSAGKSQFIPILAGLLFLTLIVSMIKFPIITWKFNTYAQIYVSSLMWIILNRFISLISQQDINIATFIIGIPIFVIFSFWIVNKRVLKIIK